MLDPEKFLLDHLSEIERIASSIGRRKRMDAAAIEEFAADVRLRLVADNYAVLRAFQGRSSFATYISAVMTRLLLDQRNREWGKWRASAEASRLGEVALALEQMLYRYGRTVDEAYFELRREYPDVTRAEVDALALRLPRRIPRRLVEVGAASSIRAGGDVSNSLVRSELAARISRALRDHIRTFSRDDQLLLRLRFDSEMTVAQIARSFKKDQQALYRRLYRLLQGLEALLEGAGITAGEVAELIGDDTVLLDFRLKGSVTLSPDDDQNHAAGSERESP